MPAPPPTRTASGALFAALTLVGWSSVPLFLKYFTDHTDSWTMNGWRYGLSALIWLPVLVVARFRRRLPRGLWKAALIPSLINTCGQCFFAKAPYYIEPAMLTFMLRFQIVFVAAGAYVLFPGERAVLKRKAYWIGVAVTFGGSIGVCLFGERLPTATTTKGILLAMTAGIFFAGYSVAVRRFMSRFTSVFSFAAISQYTAAGVLAIMLLAGHNRGADPLAFDKTQLTLLGLSAVAGIALAHVFYYASIARLGVTVAAGLILLQPFFTGLGSYFWFDERLTPTQWACGITAMMGAVFMLYAQHQTQQSIPNPDTPAGRSGA